MEKRKIRVGIDVGGTHTKAVAIDNQTKQIIGKSSVKTTHAAQAGVAEGVVASFLKCLEEHDISADEVVFVAHSTTQATNALLEGDVAKVGVIATAGGSFEAFLTKRQTSLNRLELGTWREIQISSRFIHKKSLVRNGLLRQLMSFVQKGVRCLSRAAHLVSMIWILNDKSTMSCMQKG